jgi:hypothetical protein
VAALSGVKGLVCAGAGPAPGGLSEAGPVVQLPVVLGGAMFGPDPAAPDMFGQ